MLVSAYVFARGSSNTVNCTNLPLHEHAPVPRVPIPPMLLCDFRRLLLGSGKLIMGQTRATIDGGGAWTGGLVRFVLQPTVAQYDAINHTVNIGVFNRRVASRLVCVWRMIPAQIHKHSMTSTVCLGYSRIFVHYFIMEFTLTKRHKQKLRKITGTAPRAVGTSEPLGISAFATDSNRVKTVVKTGNLKIRK